MSKQVPCVCGGVKGKEAQMCWSCRYPRAGKFLVCPSCGGAKTYRAKHCASCWGPFRRSPISKRRHMDFSLAGGVDEGLDLLAQSWGLTRSEVVRRLVLAAARQTERELRRDKVA